MLASELLSVLDYWDSRAGIWAYSTSTLHLIFREPRSHVTKYFARHVKAGHIQHIAYGLYVYPSARSLPPDVLSHLVSFLRPWDFSYLSLESVLSEAGWISEVPSKMTLMTTGRSQTYDTPYGLLEFVHTECDPATLRDDLAYDSRRELHIATPTLALRDLKRVSPNLNIVSTQNDDAPSHAN